MLHPFRAFLPLLLILPCAAAAPPYKSPVAIAFSPKGDVAYVANHTANSVAVVDTAKGKMLAEVPVGKAPTGIAVSPDGTWLYVANTHGHSVSVVNTKSRKVVTTIPCGFEPRGVALTRDGSTLYTANYISSDLSVVDTKAGKEIRRIRVPRTPTYLALTPDGKRLLVNHLLSSEPATNPNLTTAVSVVDTAQGKVVGQKHSPGTMLLGQGITVSQDGKFAFCVHSRPNFNVTPSQLNQGWVHTNALTMIPLASDGKVMTVLLDNVNSGAANPHDVATSKDGKRLYVTHRGIHKVSVIDLVRLRALIQRTPPKAMAMAHVNLGFLWQQGNLVRRVSSGGLCPNGLAVSPSDGRVYVANYFSDNIGVLDPLTGKVIRRIDLGGPKNLSLERKGEFLFHDAAHCFQQWLSCTSCHPGTRADGVNWDLMNDGFTNPKNAKSLVGSWQTPPAMWRGVRPSMEVAVEKGFLFIQFTQPHASDLKEVRAYLRSAPYIPSPWHRKPDGTLDAQAARGRKVFAKAMCAECHPAPLYTDKEMYDVGTRSKRDLPDHSSFDTPSLIELYRTAPYLHDGRAATLRGVLTKFNPDDEHGVTSSLSKQEIDDLIAFLKSL